MNKDDISFMELFRLKLENAEIVPGDSVRSKLMRKLSIREFLRFNTARPNIYYVGGILVTATIVAIIFSSEPKNSDQITSANISGYVSKENRNVQGEQTAVQKPDSLHEKAFEPIKNKPVIRPKVVSAEEPAQNIGSRVNTSVTYMDINGSSVKKSLFFEASPEKNELQGMIKPGNVLFETSAKEGCTPLKLRFYNKSDSFDSCKWTFGDGGYSYEKNPEWIFDVEGEYKVILNLFGSDGLQASSSVIITVYPKPLALFEIASDKAVLSEDEIRFYNYSANAIHFNWDFGDGNTSEIFEPSHRYAKPGNYNVRLMVSSDYGCSDSLVVSNALSGSEYFINFPNAFIPDNQGPTGGYYSSKSDETAQVFHPVFSGVSDYQLKIFSKLGILIFESSDINIGWDGYLDGQLSAPGVYIWKVRGNFRNGEPFIKMGDVTLLKKLM
ncbi:MAG: PKD domain-containing protein [Bacteroidota bacterium]